MEQFAPTDLIPSDCCLWALFNSEVRKMYKTNYWSKFGCCCSHKETWKSTQKNNTRSSCTSCKVHWGCRWDCRTSTV